jgi:preprotein translocase subunit SecG
MATIITIVHILVCLFLVVIVLLQHGKGADIGATFGGSGQSLFGTEGPVPLLNKVTTAAAIVFMLTSITLAYMSAHRGSDSIMDDFTVPAPAAPAADTMDRTSEKAPTTIPMPVQTPAGEETAPAQFPGQESETK